MKYEETARRLKQAMNEANISAADLSRKSGVGKPAISHYTSGRYCPHNTNAVALANVLNVNPIWLMGFDVDKHINKNKPDKEELFNSFSDEFIEELSKLDERKMVLVLAYLKAINGDV